MSLIPRYSNQHRASLQDQSFPFSAPHLAILRCCYQLPQFVPFILLIVCLSHVGDLVCTTRFHYLRMDLNEQVTAKEKLSRNLGLTWPGIYGLVGKRNKLLMLSITYCGVIYSFPFSTCATGLSIHMWVIPLPESSSSYRIKSPPNERIRCWIM